MKEEISSNFRKIKLFIKRIIHFFTVKIWLVSAEVGLSAFKKVWYKVSRILSITVKQFQKNQCTVSASDLTYYSLFAVVPFFAIAYGVAMLFGLEYFLNSQIYSALGGQENLGERLMTFSQRIISEAKVGVISVVALVFFFWSIITMLSSIEKTMNNIWNVRKRRRFVSRMLGFLLFVLIVPSLLVIGSAANIFISANIIRFFPELLQESLQFLTSFLIPVGIFCVLFFIIYQSVPYQKINPRSSFWAAIFAGAAFQALQYYYFNVQIAISSYNTIYGSLAALPLLLVWIKLSWTIVLFGAELAYGIEHERNFTSSRQFRQASRNL
ncbi:MAG: YihY/virulence factor BrkB family protein [Bacteroidales bacterium]|nr:YihY/virulence factor BrkB family protein [Bacteroidales bacterium]